MKLVTYNVHKCRGIDGRTNAHRIADILAAIDADIIALQEIFSSADEKAGGQVEMVASALAMNFAFGTTRQIRGRPYGNAVLSRWPILGSEHLDLSWKWRERRGCLRADVKTPRGTLHLLNIHMGTSFFERRHQVRQLFTNHLQDKLPGPCVVVGDFNEWPSGLATRMLAERFESLNLQLHVRRRRSYPGIMPLLHLDHIYFERPLHVERAELVRTRLSMIASDHLPLAAVFDWQ